MKNKIQIYIGAFFLAALVFPLKNIQAAELNVPSQFSSISSAIKKALPGDTILVSAGTYNEKLWVDKNVEIRSVSGPENTVISAQGGGSVIVFYRTTFDGTRSAKISGFTIRDGNSNDGQGGGVTFAYSDAVVENNRIINNSAKVDGGGILFSLNSNGVVRNNFIDSNGATRFGAGIMVVNNSNPLIYNNHISNNNASGPTYSNWGAGGGAIFVDGNSSPQIIKNTITTNRADHAGGAISLRVGCSSVIEENTITNNNAAYGGGIHIETGGSAPTIKNNIISNNQANTSASFSGSGFGGGVSVFDKSTPNIASNTISDNFATQGGGGIVVSENANATISANKIYSNKTTTNTGDYTGGGIYVADSSATIFNNVIYKNEARIGGGIGLLNAAKANIQNNTIVSNLAPFSASRPSGGGISVLNSVTSASIINNIITKNQDYQVFEEHKKATVNNNLINNDDRGIYFNWDSGAVSDVGVLNGSSGVNADANVSGAEGFLDANGGNYKINNLSSGIDAGTGGLVSAMDIDHVSRLTGSAPDAGAYEYSASARATYPMYRFWSDTKKHHFYTIEKSERDAVLNTYFHSEWKYEGIAFRAFKITDCQGGFPVHRFWSDTYQGHFYTINESEKNSVIDNYDDSVWKYEGSMYCADTASNSDNKNLYRFWSDTYNGHFYTADEGEKDYINANYPANVWRYEIPAFRVYPE